MTTEQAVVVVSLTPRIHWWLQLPGVFAAVDKTIVAQEKRWTGFPKISDTACAFCKQPWKVHLSPDRKCPFEASKFGMDEKFRQELMESVNRNKDEREILEQRYGDVWDTRQVQEVFAINGFLAPFTGVVRKSDGARGALMFQHMPRYYFSFVTG